MSEKYTAEIVALEFGLFDKVNNIGGRASCQDDFQTFEAMRGAQFDAWNDTMRESYLADLTAAKERGRNLVEEKYAYMTGYDYMGELDGYERKQELVDEIMDLMNEDTLAFRMQYPGVASRSRAFGHDAGNTPSVNRYLLCELMTYSAHTLELMAPYIRELRGRGTSLPMEIHRNIADRYGFESLDEMEHRLASLSQTAS